MIGTCTSISFKKGHAGYINKKYLDYAETAFKQQLKALPSYKDDDLKVEVNQLPYNGLQKATFIYKDIKICSGVWDETNDSIVSFNSSLDFGGLLKLGNIAGALSAADDALFEYEKNHNISDKVTLRHLFIMSFKLWSKSECAGVSMAKRGEDNWVTESDWSELCDKVYGLGDANVSKSWLRKCNTYNAVEDSVALESFGMPSVIANSFNDEL